MFSRQDQVLLRQIVSIECDFVPNDLFKKRNAERLLFSDAPKIEWPDTSWYHPVIDGAAVDPHSGRNKTVLLTADEEKTLFLQYNYCRYRVAKIRAKVRSGPEAVIKPKLAQHLLHWQRRVELHREHIANTNLALVLAMAKRTRMSEVDFTEMVSEGNMALLRAVDKFDVARGFKFSTYACRAILKAFSRSGVKLSRYRQMFPTDYDPKFEKSDYMELKRETHKEDCVEDIRQIMAKNLAELTTVERSVIEHRFAVGHKAEVEPEAEPMTLAQVGCIIGVTKERVRQIQNKALDKIRKSLEDGFLG